MVPFFLKVSYVMTCNKPSDINEHLPILNEMANKCDHITEFGTGIGNSSTAFLNSEARFISYDIRRLPEAVTLFEESTKLERDAHYINGGTLEIENFEPTDLLFIDDLHTYNQVKQELSLYAHFVKKWIAFHDTTLFETVGEDGGMGIWPAIEEFLNDNSDWDLIDRRTNNNGLTILERI